MLCLYNPSTEEAKKSTSLGLNGLTGKLQANGRLCLERSTPQTWPLHACLRAPIPENDNIKALSKKPSKLKAVKTRLRFT